MKREDEKQSKMQFYTDEKNKTLPPCRATNLIEHKQNTQSKLAVRRIIQTTLVSPKTVAPMVQKALIQSLLFQQNEEQENDVLNDISPGLEKMIDNISLSDLIDFFCPYCGSITSEGHVKKDLRGRIHKLDVQRWECKKFHRKFTNDFSPFNYPLWVCYFTCLDLAAGMELEAIKKSLEMIAKEKGVSISITTSAIRRLLERILQFIHEFEEAIKHPIESDVWEIDELSQRMSKQDSKRRRSWLITVTADSSRYLLATHVCERRSYKNSLKALQIARSRAKSDPKIVKCDGLRSHEKAAKKLFPNATVISIPKRVYFGNISHEERTHKTVRLGALRKRRRFYSPKTLEIYAEFDRIDYNFVRVNDAPLEKPAQKAGIDFSIRDWQDLLYAALRFHAKEQLIEAHRKLYSK
jgi:transposase-like protein